MLERGLGRGRTPECELLALMGVEGSDGTTGSGLRRLVRDGERGGTHGKGRGDEGEDAGCTSTVEEGSGRYAADPDIDHELDEDLGETGGSSCRG